MYAIRIVIPFNAAMFMKEGTLESFDSGDIHGGVWNRWGFEAGLRIEVKVDKLAR